MSDPLLHAESFEQLLRWIYDKPLYTRPQRGKPPEHLFAEDKVNLGTSARFRLAIEAVRRDKASAPAAVRDYLNTFAENLEIFRIEESEEGKEFDEQVVESIDAFLPYRDELVDLFLTITQYRSDSEVYETIHAFFERVLPYGFWPAGYPQWTKWNADNFKFILYELFLYATATLIKSNRFDKVNSLLEQGYYFPPGSPEMSPGGLVPFTYFRNYLQSLEYRNQRLNLQRTDLVADLIKERAKRTDLTFDDIMQADFILYIRHQLNDQEGDHARHSWFPVTLLYAAERYQPFEIFARAQSAKYFDRIRTALGVSHKDELVKLIEQYQSGTRRPPQWHVFAELDPAIAMAVEKIATQP
jgi:hypothetical protein